MEVSISNPKLFRLPLDQFQSLLCRLFLSQNDQPIIIDALIKSCDAFAGSFSATQYHSLPDSASSDYKFFECINPPNHSYLTSNDFTS
jgi:hypothetical protein